MKGETWLAILVFGLAVLALGAVLLLAAGRAAAPVTGWFRQNQVLYTGCE